jgi:hypothetical protein
MRLVVDGQTPESLSEFWRTLGAPISIQKLIPTFRQALLPPFFKIHFLAAAATTQPMS